jgi:hypothetical protein
LRPKDLQYIGIDKSIDFVTEFETPGLPQVYALRQKGVRTNRPGLIFERDFGTRHRFDEYPQTPNPEGLPIEMVKGPTIYDPTTGLEYEVVLGLDVAGGSHLYVSESEWPELTRQLKALVNGAPSGKTIQLLYIADYLDQPATIAESELVGWIAENTTKAQCALVTANDTSSADLDLLVDGTGLDWDERDEITFHATDATLHGWKFDNGDTPHVRHLVVEPQRKVYMLTGSSGSPIVPNYPFAVERYDERKYFVGLRSEWAVDHDYGLGDDVWDTTPVYTYSCTTAHTSSADTQPGVGVHWQDYWKIEAANASAGETLAAGWYAELAGGLIPITKETASVDAPFDLSSGASLSDVLFEDPEANEWLKLSVSKFLIATGARQTHARVAMTVLYDDYMESDPVWYGYFTHSSTVSISILLLDLQISLARMPKHVSGFRFYVAMVDETDIPESKDWPFAEVDYKLWEEVTINEASELVHDEGPEVIKGQVDWSFDPTAEKSYSIRIGLRLDDAVAEQGLEGTLLSNLGHGVSKDRSRVKPRFAADATGERGAIVVMDQDDRTLRLCNFNGDKIVEDGNFPNTANDNDGNPLVLGITGHGDLMGLAVLRDRLCAIHRGGIEIRDFQSGQFERLVTVDVVSKDSINDKGPGLSWAGNSALWLLPIDGGAEYVINPLWRNLYDGRLKIADGVAPYVSAEARQAIVSGWDYYYGEKIFVIAVLTDDGSDVEYIGFRWDGKHWSPKELFPKPITN